MKNYNAGKITKLLFVSAFLIFFSLKDVEAQNNLTIDLAGSEWVTEAEAIPTDNTDDSVTTITRYLVFYKSGKVVATIVTNKSAGAEYKQVQDRHWLI